MSDEPVDRSCNLWRRLGELQLRLPLTDADERGNDADYTDTTKIGTSKQRVRPFPRSSAFIRVHPRQAVVALLPAHTKEFA